MFHGYDGVTPHEFNEWDEDDPKLREYIEFARASDSKFVSVSQARLAFRQCEKAIAYMNHTFSGCDWCDNCGGGNIAVSECEAEKEDARKYLLSQGESIEDLLLCHTCWQAEGVERTDKPYPTCRKCFSIKEGE